jgi:hypothetical protein
LPDREIPVAKESAQGPIGELHVDQIGTDWRRIGIGGQVRRNSQAYVLCGRVRWFGLPERALTHPVRRRLVDHFCPVAAPQPSKIFSRFREFCENRSWNRKYAGRGVTSTDSRDHPAPLRFERARTIDGRRGASVDAAVAVAGVPQSRRTGAFGIGRRSEPRSAAKLRSALATSTLYTRGLVHELGAVWTRTCQQKRRDGAGAHARKLVWWRGNAVRRPPARSRKRSSSRSAICSISSALVRDAASSMASGMPPSLRQMVATVATK